MPKEPTIYDILGWEQDWSPREVDQPPEGTQFTGGQVSMADYLSDLLNKSGAYKGITGTGEGALRLTEGTELDMNKAMSGLYGREDFMSMGRSDLEDFIRSQYGAEFETSGGVGEYTGGYGLDPTKIGAGESGSEAWKAENLEELYGMGEDERLEALWGQYSDWYGKEANTMSAEWGEIGKEDFLSALTGDIGFEKKYQPGDIDFEEGDLKALLDYSQAMQEGLGRVGSITEKFGLSGQLTGEEIDSERERSSALQAYMPREITSRYRSLQGGGGGDMGEMAEAEYLSTLSAADRRRGRNVRSIYGELEDEMFGGIGQWMENVTS